MTATVTSGSEGVAPCKRVEFSRLNGGHGKA